MQNLHPLMSFIIHALTESCFRHYFKLLNNHAANLINFLKNSILHVLIPSCTFINFGEIFHPARLFDLEKNPICTVFLVSQINLFIFKVNFEFGRNLMAILRFITTLASCSEIIFLRITEKTILRWFFDVLLSRIFLSSRLFLATRLLTFEKMPAYTFIPSCMFINFEKFANLHVYSILHNYSVG